MAAGLLLALSIHTTIGSTIHNWGDHYGDDAAAGGNGSSHRPPGLTPEQVEAAARGQMIQKAWTVIGIA